MNNIFEKYNRGTQFFWVNKVLSEIGKNINSKNYLLEDLATHEKFLNEAIDGIRTLQIPKSEKGKLYEETINEAKKFYQEDEPNIDDAISLIGAIKDDKIEKVQELCRKNGVADGIYGDNSPLLEAIYSGRTHIIPILLQSGADANKVAGSKNFTPLHMAVFSENIAAVTELLKYDSLNLNPQDKIDGSTPLHIAAKKGNKAIYDLLLEYGADASIANNNGRTPQDYLSKTSMMQPAQHTIV